MSRCFAKLFKHPELLEPATSGVSKVLFRYKQAKLGTPPDAAGFSVEALARDLTRAVER
jgi:hypothetical protein